MDIRLSHLSIGYTHAHPVATDLNATLRSGQLTCLIGDNGIGKSTLLRTLSGALTPVEGEIWLGARLLTSLSARERAQVVAIVLTHRPDAGGLSVRQLVGLGRSPYTDFWGNLRMADQIAVQQSLSDVGALPLADRRIDTLSDGECQKVMIARALAQQTPVILLDEPTAFLDFHSRISSMQLLARLAHTTGKTILLSTHDLQLAAELADTLLQLSPHGLTIVDRASVKDDIKQRLFTDHENE